MSSLIILVIDMICFPLVYTPAYSKVPVLLCTDVYDEYEMCDFDPSSQNREVDYYDTIPPPPQPSIL